MTNKQAQKNRPVLKSYEDRPVGSPAQRDPSAMTKVESDAHRAAVERLSDLFKKAEKGDSKAVPEIRKILQESPDLAWRFMDLARSAERQFIEGMTKDKDLASRETLEFQLAAMREDVAGENPSPLERLLAERIVLTWLQIQLFEGLYASSMFKSMTLTQGSYYQKRLDLTYRRHLSAIRALAQIRKLGPAVQINIAEKQINTAG